MAPSLPQWSPRIRRRHNLRNYVSLASTNESYNVCSSVGAPPTRHPQHLICCTAWPCTITISSLRRLRKAVMVASRLTTSFLAPSSSQDRFPFPRKLRRDACLWDKVSAILTHCFCHCGPDWRSRAALHEKLLYLPDLVACARARACLTSYKGKSLGSSAVCGTYVCIDTTSPCAKQLVFWTLLA